MATYKGPEKWRLLGEALLETTGARHVRFYPQDNMRFILTFKWSPAPLWLSVHDVMVGPDRGARRWTGTPEMLKLHRDTVERCLLLLM